VRVVLQDRLSAVHRTVAVTVPAERADQPFGDLAGHIVVELADRSGTMRQEWMDSDAPSILICRGQRAGAHCCYAP
jgi:hypothetical protein